MTNLQRQLGATVRSARIERGWSQERLAETAALDRSYVGEIERGLVSPTLVTLQKLAQALDLAASELISRCESREQSAPAALDTESLAGHRP